MNRIFRLEFNQLNWISIGYLLGIPLLSLAFLPWALREHAFTWPIVLYALVHFSIDCLSVTVGYHRLFSHKSYEAHPVLRSVMLITGAGAFQNSALVWAKDHRVHHRDVDTDSDPYSIKKGFWYAHFFWMFKKDSPIDYEKLPADLKKDKMLRLQDKYYLPLAIVVGFGVPMLVGHILVGSFAVGLYVGAILRLLLSGHCTFCINSVAHVIGTRPFCVTNTARDNWFLSLLTFGEGYHNYHHKFQADYRNGLYWYAWDPSKWIIFLFSKVGLTRKLIRVAPERVLLARMEVSESKLQEKGYEVTSLIKKRQLITRLSRKMEGIREKLSAFSQTGRARIDRSERAMVLVYRRKVKIMKRLQKRLETQWDLEIKILQSRPIIFPRV